MPSRLRPGQPAPPLVLEDADGVGFDLTSLPIERFLLLEVYRGAHCPRCHRHCLDLDAASAALQRRGVQVALASMDDRKKAQAARAGWGLKALTPFHGLTLGDAAAWGLFVTMPDAAPHRPFAEPATFLIQPDRTIHTVLISSSPFLRYHAADMLEAIDSIIARGVPPRGTMAV